VVNVAVVFEMIERWKSGQSFQEQKNLGNGCSTTLKYGADEWN